MKGEALTDSVPDRSVQGAAALQYDTGDEVGKPILPENCLITQCRGHSDGLSIVMGQTDTFLSIIIWPDCCT